ncbi:MAG: helix-turn-helix transcriptional regulator [Mucispirillum sp.]|nr:helix-turn-helix transcriptional regulator [Mucispirillum sp.]
MDLEQKSKIIQALVLKGITQKALASDIGVSTQFLGEVISGKSRSHRVEQKITEVTGYIFPTPQRVPRSLAVNN